MTEPRLSIPKFDETGSVLLVVDVQNSFMPGGELGVEDGDAIVPIINRLAQSFNQVVITQDWHPAGHISFVNNHPGKQRFETIETVYGPQCLWPAHCIQGSDGANLHPDLELHHAQLIIRKGFHPNIDSYSAFTEADRRTSTGLAAYLRAHQIKSIFIVGLATDFCVAWSAIDARLAGFDCWVLNDACRAIDVDDSLVKAYVAMKNHGVQIITSNELTLTRLV